MICKISVLEQSHVFYFMMIYKRLLCPDKCCLHFSWVALEHTSLWRQFVRRGWITCVALRPQKNTFSRLLTLWKTWKDLSHCQNLSHSVQKSRRTARLNDFIHTQVSRAFNRRLLEVSAGVFIPRKSSFSGSTEQLFPSTLCPDFV